MSVRVVNREAMVPYTDKQMYALVEDVASYPQFLPWCTGSELKSQNADELVASLTIGYAGLNGSFATRKELRAPKSMSMQLLDGPFSRLDGLWNFKPLGDAGCEVVLRVEFEFSSGIQDMLFGGIFQNVCNELIDAFVKRAHDLYG